MPESPKTRGVVALSSAAWFATLAGLCGSCVGIGLSRFAYTPLIPSLIEARWFSSADVVRLTAANFAGYFAGALLGRALARRLSDRLTLRLMMVVATVAFFACATPVSVLWFFLWRFASGFAGGALTVLAATTVLPHVPPSRRGFASGMIFLGAGLGVVASGTLIPALLPLGLRDTWIGIGILSLLLTALSWFGWPDGEPPPHLADADVPDVARNSRALYVLYSQYALNALGFVPGIILLVDFVARGLSGGALLGAQAWTIFGFGALIGPILCGAAGDRIGFRAAYQVALILQAISCLALALATQVVWTFGPALILGIFTPGVVPLALGRIQDILPHNPPARQVAWSHATTAFALFQVVGGYGYAFLFNRSHDYALVFLCGGAMFVAASLTDLLGGVGPGRRRPA